MGIHLHSKINNFDFSSVQQNTKVIVIRKCCVTEKKSDHLVFTNLFNGYIRSTGFTIDIADDLIDQMIKYWKTDCIEFEWNGIDNDRICNCDQTHLSYIALLGLNEINTKRNEKNKHVSNKTILLRYLQIKNMNGAKFVSMTKKQWEQDLKDNYILLSGVSSALYHKICKYDFKSIENKTVCTLPISSKQQHYIHLRNQLHLTDGNRQNKHLQAYYSNN